VGSGWHSAIDLTLGNVSKGSGSSAEDGTLANRAVVCDPCLTSQDGTITDTNRTCEADLRDKHSPSSYLAVVRNLNEIVDPRVRTNGCMAQGAAVYAGKSAYVSPVTDTHSTHLRNRSPHASTIWG